MEKYNKCPVCENNTLKYDSELEANRCYYNHCGWTDKTGPFIGGDISFLEYCLSLAKPGRPKEVIEKIIEETNMRR